MTTKVPAWSHTSLTAYETCPKQYYHTRVAKDVPQSFGEAALWGQKVHKLLEERAKVGTALPDYLEFCEPILSSILEKDGTLLVEEKMAVDANLHPVEFFDKKAWGRGVVDIGKVNEHTAVIFDYKTGARKPENDQLRLFSAFTFAKYPWVNKVIGGFIWLKDKKLDKQVFTRKQHMAELWGEIIPRANRVDKAYQDNVWPEKPSGLCRAHCPVKSCKFNGSR